MSEFKDHLRVLVDSLASLSPSRNIITQFILMLPRDATTVENSYPELVEKVAEEILTKLGVEFGKDTSRSGFSEELYRLLHAIFDWLDDGEVRRNLAKLVGSEVPNPYEEWAKAVLKKISTKPLGEKTIEFLTMLLEKESYEIRSDWDEFMRMARTRLGVSEIEFEEVCSVVKDDIRHLSKRERRKAMGSILHDDYHLDLLKFDYDERFVLRHAETIRRVLKEVREDGKDD